MQSSNLSPAMRSESLTTTPPKLITATSVVPPPISTTMQPFGSAMGNKQVEQKAVIAGTVSSTVAEGTTVKMGDSLVEISTLTGTSAAARATVYFYNFIIFYYIFNTTIICTCGFSIILII
jgi:hypothetical protein